MFNVVTAPQCPNLSKGNAWLAHLVKGLSPSSSASNRGQSQNLRGGTNVLNHPAQLRKSYHDGAHMQFRSITSIACATSIGLQETSTTTKMAIRSRGSGEEATLWLPCIHPSTQNPLFQLPAGGAIAILQLHPAANAAVSGAIARGTQGAPCSTLVWDVHAWLNNRPPCRLFRPLGDDASVRCDCLGLGWFGLPATPLVCTVA